MKRHRLLKTVMPKLLLLGAFAVLSILTSPSCSNEADTCADKSDCLNGGTRVNGTSSYSCACAQGFTGHQCETNIDDCAGRTLCLNGGTCVDGTSSYTCACAEAFFGDHCEHRNECVYPGACSSLSTLSRDATCKCRRGYAPDPHHSSKCELEYENATLIFGSSYEGIEQFSLSQQTVTRIHDHSEVGYALDVMYRTNTMFWNDEHGNIYTAPIRRRAVRTFVLNHSGSHILSLAVDWVYGHLYFADSERHTISVAKLDGSIKKVLLTIGIANTTAIVVDPLSGLIGISFNWAMLQRWMYLADDRSRNITRAAMDGSGQEVLVNIEPKIPVCLALDMMQHRLYWTTWEFDHPASVYSMNVDGSDLKLIFQSTQPIFLNSYFVSITTFGDFVYWRDVETNAVYRTNKCGGGEATAIHFDTSHPDAYQTIRAYHFSMQPEGVNYCENRIGGRCSHLCFRIPSTENQTVATTCACLDGLTLSSGQRTCT